MARGRKKALPLEGQLEQVIQQIADTEDQVKALKLRKKELEERVKIQKLSELNELIEKNGMSLEEASELIQNAKE